MWIAQIQNMSTIIDILFVIAALNLGGGRINKKYIQSSLSKFRLDSKDMIYLLCCRDKPLLNLFFVYFPQSGQDIKL